MGYEKPQEKTVTDRLVSLDAYRGFVMLAMVSSGLGMSQIHKTWSHDSIVWRVADQFSHREWIGCTFWDLIQPSFMFIVGVAMPFAFVLRQQRGETWRQQFGHAIRRAFLLILIGIFLDSIRRPAPEIQFIRVLQQIAIGYVIAFLVLHRGPIVQAATAILLLVGHTVAFVWYWKAHGINPWDGPSDNIGKYLDQTIHSHLTTWANHVHQALFQTDCAVSLWPVSGQNYVAINAISSAATILFGVLCGELLRTRWSDGTKLKLLFVAGIGGILVGAGLSLEVPMVKKIWTSSFGIYAAGWTFLMIFLFFLVIDVWRWRLWAFPFVVVGMNSIAIYISAGVMGPVIRECLRPFVGPSLSYVPDAAPVIMALLVVVVQWLFVYWLYRHRIFFRV